MGSNRAPINLGGVGCDDCTLIVRQSGYVNNFVVESNDQLARDKRVRGE